MPRHAVLALDDDRRGAATSSILPSTWVVENTIVAPRLVQQRRAGLLRRQHVDDRRQLLEIERHVLRQILRRGAGAGEAHRHRLADEAHLAGGERRIVRGLEAGDAGVRLHRLDAGEVPGDEDPVPGALRLQDGADAGMGERAAQKCHVLQAGHGMSET